MKQKQHGEKQRIRGDNKCPINKDGVMAENSKWLDIHICGPQTPASRLNQLVKHGKGSQSLFPLCLFSIFFLHPGCLGVTSRCNGQDISIHHPSLSKTYSTIPWSVEEIGKEAWCTWLSIPTIPSSGFLPNGAFPHAHVCISEFLFGPLDLLLRSAHSVSPHLVQSPTMPLEVSGFVSFSGVSTYKQNKVRGKSTLFLVYPCPEVHTELQIKKSITSAMRIYSLKSHCFISQRILINF